MNAMNWIWRAVLWVVGFGVGYYFTPLAAAFYHWSCAKRDELANRAKVAKRERR